MFLCTICNWISVASAYIHKHAFFFFAAVIDILSVSPNCQGITKVRVQTPTLKLTFTDRSRAELDKRGGLNGPSNTAVYGIDWRAKLIVCQ